jgi:hypothetical protein
MPPESDIDLYIPIILQREMWLSIFPTIATSCVILEE